MSYQEIKRISKGRKWMILTLILLSVFLICLKRIARAQDTFEVSRSASVTSADYWVCSHSPFTVTYTFDSFIVRDLSRVYVEGNNVNKCEPVFVDLSVSGIWGGRLAYSPPSPCSATPCSVSPCTACGGCACACGCACSACGPPLDIADCSSMDDCLDKGNLYNLDSQGQGKGVLQRPSLAHLIPITSSPDFGCAGNSCIAYEPGTYTFQEKVNATTYYGMCQNLQDCNNYCVEVIGGCGYPSGTVCYDSQGQICFPTAMLGPYKLSGDIPEVANNVSYTVVNRAPTVSINSSSSEVNLYDEIDVTCTVADPDCIGVPGRADKPSSIKWNCFDSEGESTDCFFEQDGDWKSGTITQDLTLLPEVTNPFSSTVKFKAEAVNNYTIACEAKDDDATSPMTAAASTNVNALKLFRNCQISSETGERDRVVCVPTESDLAPDVTYKATWQGINPVSFNWNCPSVEGIQTTDSSTHKCDYEIGTYMPSLSIVDQDGEVLPCTGNISTKVTCTPLCMITAKEVGSLGDYFPNISAIKTKEVDAKIYQECLSTGTTTWNVTGGNVVSSTNTTANIDFKESSLSQTKIQAIMEKEGVNTACSEANVDLTEKLRWGN